MDVSELSVEVVEEMRKNYEQCTLTIIECLNFQAKTSSEAGWPRQAVITSHVATVSAIVDLVLAVNAEVVKEMEDEQGKLLEERVAQKIIESMTKHLSNCFAVEKVSGNDTHH